MAKAKFEHYCTKEDVFKSILKTLDNINQKLENIEKMQVKVEYLEKNSEQLNKVIFGNSSSGLKQKVAEIEKTINNLSEFSDELDRILNGDEESPGLKTKLSNLYLTVSFITAIGSLVSSALFYAVFDNLFKK